MPVLVVGWDLSFEWILHCKVCYIRFFSETLRLFEDLLEQVEQDYSSSNEDFTSARNRRPANAALELQRNRLGLTTA